MDTRSLELIESAREQVTHAVRELLCDGLAAECLAIPLTDWERVTRFWTDESITLLVRLSEPACPQAPIAAGLVADLRALVSLVLHHHNRWRTWAEVTDAAERTAQHARWASNSIHALTS
ncbi:hypothetical protein [Catenuloplanes japonicus]|uniref:hypothetical protein n=1 Tax=Catenuloplanes japonicus TaxID=33876 RepID=UPI000A5D35EA|nr:hypothetical protein [Catenuloplanes japonicus]